MDAAHAATDIVSTVAAEQQHGPAPHRPVPPDAHGVRPYLPFTHGPIVIGEAEGGMSLRGPLKQDAGKVRETDLPIIPSPPAAFDGTLDELFDGWARKVLIQAEIVADFHGRLCKYLQSTDPLFLVRMAGGMTRGATLRSTAGLQMRGTDNAPAWWIHRELFVERFGSHASFAALVEGMPCHMFHLPKGANISSAGWHVAHIFDVKNGDVAFLDWDRNGMVRRMVRNIHPCNYFYVPKTDWQRVGGDPTVIAFFYEKFASVYHAVWPEFLRLVGGTPPTVPVGVGNHRIAYSVGGPLAPRLATGPVVSAAEVERCVASYEYSRLCFKADVIEPLAMDDKFAVVTKVGTFVLTKRDFYEAFPGVVASKNYRLNGLYHFPKPPRRALQFLVSSEPE